ncbi:MAG: Hsp20/alpha crystallin family protein [Candidatus Schekmanbacteria bacterium]|nr:MAG: Hsp20/alpha crystallin family protein [Candidatus Schekmanbacteria bacterium]
MAIVKWDPFKDMISIKDRMNRLFDEVFSRSHFYGDEDLTDGLWTPAVDIYETDDSVVLKAELPEVDEKDIEIKLEDNVLTIRGERKLENETKKENYYRMERAYGAFSRSFSIPSRVEQDKITATCKDGVLKVTMPKKKEAQHKKIPINVG